VLENPSNNEFFRIGDEAYEFIARLDGHRTVAEAYRICNELLGDGAPTQGEVIRLLGQLHCANLLYADLPPDCESLFDRYRKRTRRQIQGYFSSFLFVRIPLLDPDLFLDRWVGVFGWVFSWLGLALWLALLASGLYFIIGNIGELVNQSAAILAPGNLLLLYLCLVLLKVVHEFSHAFACKRFGKLSGSRGEVHTMGVMFLVFFPVPYLDASSAWAFREKWHRVVVGAAGILAELAVAATAAIIWANTSTGVVPAIAYNLIFIASVSTLLFNGNPLLRFDAYYVLSDLLEIPNLWQRSRSYFYYLVKGYVWRLKQAHDPAHSIGERVWFVLYGAGSIAYRVFICIRILLFLSDRLPEQLFVLVPVLAFSAVLVWVLMPIGKFVRYLATSPELARRRARAVGSTVATLGVIAACVGALRVPDHCRVQAIVEPTRLAVVYAEVDGFVKASLPLGERVSPDGQALVKAVNHRLTAQKKSLLSTKRGLEAKRRLVAVREIAAAQIVAEQIEALGEQIERIDSELSSLQLRAPLAGTWIPLEAERLQGAYLRRGQRLGVVASLDEVVIRATAGQQVAAMIVEEAYGHVEIRVKGRPESTLTGRIERISPAGREVLPSRALGYAVGGSMPTLAQDSRGIMAAERFFEIRIRLVSSDSARLLTGQRLVVRIQMPAKPLGAQWWRAARQLFQRRFHV